ncbi:putative sensor domain DACNV-containing protein [Geomonas propionica]|uniref:Probable sensor domain-containing protein n=1 Tax=Geomonas propionica TaxID=2798582 RepID=A0ABS0YME2_9BACT|nr:hypothetical protein [Geomonas propionica]MBJ6799154.1 hypothetical protein [Geomonas propionica]
MPIKNKTPRHLAEFVCTELRKRKAAVPDDEVITELMETMYYSSLRTEESEPVLFHMVFLDPSQPDPKPPRNPARDRWSYIPFADPIPFTVSNVVKIAKSTDLRTSSFVIWPDQLDQLYIWGLVDQQNRFHKFLNRSAEVEVERPGVFQASVEGIGIIAVYMRYEKVAELRVNEVIRHSLDLFREGPVRELLTPGIERFLAGVRSHIPDDIYQAQGAGDELHAQQWISVLCRILLRIQKIQNGGAILISPQIAPDDLNVKYGINYDRLPTSLQSNAVTKIKSDYLERHLLGSGDLKPKELSADQFQQLRRLEKELRANKNEIDGVIWFIALLTRVDGLVVMDPNLVVRGYGVEIKNWQEPEQVFIATDRFGSAAKQRPVSYNHFGTRHRSMMRYCCQNPGSLGFVVSQDGEVRVMTMLGERLVMWENIKLKYYSYASKRK